MNYRSKKINLTTTLLLILTFALSATTSYAAEPSKKRERNTRERGTRNTPQQRQRPNRSNRNGSSKETKATTTVSKEVETALTNMLKLVNENQRPDVQTLADASSAVKTNRKNLKTFNDDAQCKYMMLSAWSHHFAGDPPKAFLAAAKAYKADPENSDAQISQVALAILADRKPVVIKPKNKKSNSRTRQRQQPRQPIRSDQAFDPRGMGPGMPGPMGPDMRGPMAPGPGMMMRRGQPAPPNRASTSGNSKGILQLDVSAIQTDLLDPRMARLELNCVNSTKFSFRPGETGLCILFWQLDPKNDDAPEITIDPSAQALTEPNGFAPPRRKTNTRSNSRSRPRGNTLQPTDPDEFQMQAFTNLFAGAVGNSSVKFLGVNTDSLANKQKVIYKLVAKPRAWAQVLAADPASNASAFADLNIETPVMAIVTKNGTVKYTGPATGFLAPMILESISSVPATAKTRDRQSTEPRQRSSVDRPTPTEPATAAPLAQTSEDFIQVGQEYQAGKDLSYAEQYIKMGKYTTYKKGVDMCRNILQKYPDTKYAEEARKLLQKVPERYHQRFKITNEEMGL